MTTKTAEKGHNGPIKRRDFSLEHNRRKQTKKRLLADIEINRAESFIKTLESHGLTFTQWIQIQIDKTLE